MSEIQGWHAHVYFDPQATRDDAAMVRAGLAERFPAAILGRWHDVPVGPHPGAMFQVAFAPDLFPTLVPWLALHRRGLDVLVHPEPGRQRADHLQHAMWMGAVLPLKGEVLPE